MEGFRASLPDSPPVTIAPVATETIESPTVEPDAADAGLAEDPASGGLGDVAPNCVTSQGVRLQQRSPARTHMHAAANGCEHREHRDHTDAELAVRAVADVASGEGQACRSDGRGGDAGAAGPSGSFRPPVVLASPSVKGAWETQCSGLTARRRR